MKITICGSMHHIDYMLATQKALRALGHEVNAPTVRDTSQDIHLTDQQHMQLRTRLIREHLDKINASDAVLIFNEEKNGIIGYIGGSTLIEMAFAFARGLKIFLLHSPPELSYKDEIRALEPVVLHGRLEEIR